jgi:hypothetical protein
MGTMVVTDTLEFLLGTWTVDRSIEDHRSGISGHFRGTAVFAPAEGEPGVEAEGAMAAGSVAVARASFLETGELTYGGHATPARRGLDYIGRDGAALLYFTDGRLYIDLDLRAGAWRAEHLCSADRYEVRTVVRSRDQVREEWRVRGPGKDYDATTTLRRA